MAIRIIRFKFRSLLNYESVEIGDRPSISLRELVLKIVHKKNLDVRQDCDVLFSDAFTGQEYADNNIMIPSGSTVIIKRLPLGSLPSAMKLIDSFEECRVKDTKTVDASLPMDVEDINFDDLGDDLSLPDAILLCSDIDNSKKKSLSFEKANNELRRCSGQPIVGSQKHEADNLIGASLRVERNASEKKCDVKAWMQFGQTAIADPSALQKRNIPSKLRCPLCDGIFKDAVIILCCQYSFCEECIHQELVEKARCPKCFCAKNEIEDLVPNITLRKLIENNRESLNLIIGSEKDFLQYAPDGESGIYPNGVPCGVKILQREPESSHSATSIGRGSNQIATEPSYELQLRENASMGCLIPPVSLSSVQKSLRQSSLSPKRKQIDEDRHEAALVDLKSRGKGLADFADFQGGSQLVHEKGVGKSFVQTRRERKVERLCFRCGSVDHLIRNCPAASSLDVESQTGNYIFPGAMTYDKYPYWNGTSFPNSAPFMNAYNPEMMAFNPSMLPPMAFARPAYMLFGSLPPYA
ncbi:E3 ubiquitin-protein ligase RBBP6-like [Tripterygium wilfordii]|uniref:E3 ubiquitin-protein ligase RBBP6-like n=1 Tax=Tripterygium wilfordii TaxID=458696 RepID=UPI0018F863DD|nr:E3 ubiquitin-protein ligase RBBP6-like [Tripterygium wilfordii]